MFERFTKAARQIVVTSVQTAADSGADKVGPEHLLLALVTVDEGAGARVLAGYGVTETGLRAALAGAGTGARLTDDEMSALRAVGIDANEVFRRIEEAFGPGALDEPAPPPPRRRLGWLGSPLDGRAKKALELSLREAIALNHRHIGSEHILLALLRLGLSGPASSVLTEHGVTYDDAKRRTLAEVHRAA